MKIYMVSLFHRATINDEGNDTFHVLHGPSANLECMSEMCSTRLAGNTGRKKIAILAPLHNFVGLYLRN